MIVTPLAMQTWFDIAIQYTGSVMNAYSIAFANGRSVTDDVIPGEELLIPTDTAISTKELQYLLNKKTIPATSSEKLIIIGLGKMRIGKNFIVR